MTKIPFKKIIKFHRKREVKVPKRGGRTRTPQ